MLIIYAIVALVVIGGLVRGAQVRQVEQATIDTAKALRSRDR